MHHQISGAGATTNTTQNCMHVNPEARDLDTVHSGTDDARSHVTGHGPYGNGAGDSAQPFQGFFVS